MTQCDRIQRHLNDYGSITGLEAVTEYGITHLASRISEMRQAGKKIIGETETSKNRYGESVSYKRYRMEEA